jgi:hypothetical protein
MCPVEPQCRGHNHNSKEGENAFAWYLHGARGAALTRRRPQSGCRTALHVGEFSLAKWSCRERISGDVRLKPLPATAAPSESDFPRPSGAPCPPPAKPGAARGLACPRLLSFAPPGQRHLSSQRSLKCQNPFVLVSVLSVCSCSWGSHCQFFFIRVLRAIRGPCFGFSRNDAVRNRE